MFLFLELFLDEPTMVLRYNKVKSPHILNVFILEMMSPSLSPSTPFMLEMDYHETFETNYDANYLHNTKHYYIYRLKL